MQSPLRFLPFGTKHREFLHTEVCPCLNAARRCQHLKQCPDYLSLSASSCHSESKDDNFWLLAANLQTVPWKPTGQEIEFFISDPRYRIDIWYFRGPLGYMKVFHQLRNDRDCSHADSGRACKLHIQISPLRDLITISNLFKFHVYLLRMCQDNIIPLKRPVLDVFLLQVWVNTICIDKKAPGGQEQVRQLHSKLVLEM